jgi:hypothetical protein
MCLNVVHGARGCPKTKIVKRKFEDQEDTGTMPDEDTAANTAADEDHGHQAQVRGPRGDQEDTRTTLDDDAAADAVIPATPQHWGRAAAAGRVEPPQAPSTASSPAPSPRGKGAASKRAAGGGRKSARS